MIECVYDSSWGVKSYVSISTVYFQRIEDIYCRGVEIVPEARLISVDRANGDRKLECLSDFEAIWT